MKREEEQKNLLGRVVAYPTHYSPEILVAIEREEARRGYGIIGTPPFVGFDVWHAYESSFLNKSGVPISVVTKIVYPADSPYIVESKSLKLYLASLYMERLGDSSEVCGSGAIKAYDKIVSQDLSAILHTEVKVCSFESGMGVELNDFEGYKRLEDAEGIEEIEIDTYSENPALLEEKQAILEKKQTILEEKQALLEGELRCYTNLLKSNCKVTGQPDHGSLYIRMEGKIPSELSLLKYIISLRGENHFHEEICEMVYQRLYERFHPRTLTITALYTRRGGIDICPVRSNSLATIPPTLTDVTLFARPTFRR